MIAKQRMAESSSWDLVAAAQAGDAEAFGQVWRRYQPLVTAYIRRRVRDHHLTEDLTSETFLRAWRSIGTVRDQGRPVSAWLTTIALNLVRDHAKSGRVRYETAVCDAADAADLLPCPESSVEEVVLARMDATEDAVRAAALLGVLVPDQRTAIHLRLGHEWSIREVAAVMGRTEGAVKALQHRATTRLREVAA